VGTGGLESESDRRQGRIVLSEVDDASASGSVVLDTSSLSSSLYRGYGWFLTPPKLTASRRFFSSAISLSAAAVAAEMSPIPERVPHPVYDVY